MADVIRDSSAVRSAPRLRFPIISGAAARNAILLFPLRSSSKLIGAGLRRKKQGSEQANSPSLDTDQFSCSTFPDRFCRVRHGERLLRLKRRADGQAGCIIKLQRDFAPDRPNQCRFG